MKFEKVHCLFEQSGTFKYEFLKMGYIAYDYDIENQFNKTDYIIDLYNEIDQAFLHNKSIFDTFNKADLIFAFFPCIRFETQILLAFKGVNKGFENWDLNSKLLYDLQLQKELNQNYNLVTKLVIVCLERGLRLILENPYSTQHYLITHWCIKPSLIDYNRRDRGDYFEKPTAYWFINCEPENNLIMECPSIKEKRTVDNTPRGIARSLISPDYVNRFIREFIL